MTKRHLANWHTISNGFLRDVYVRAPGNERKKLNYIYVFQANAAVTDRPADGGFVIGAMEIDEARFGVRIGPIEALEPENSRQDEVARLPLASNPARRPARLEDHAQGGVTPVLGGDAEMPGWRAQAAHLESRPAC